jgi:hypothetical protein
LSDNTLEQLDQRYVNVGENVIDQNINTLNLVNLNMASNGTIYFNRDNTTQTTAFDPNFVTNQVNNFTSSDNVFTGKNDFRNLNVIDSSGGASTIYHDGLNMYVVNKKNNGIINIRLFNSSDVPKTITIDNLGNISGLNDVNCTNVKTSTLLIDTLRTIYKYTGGTFVFQNLDPGKGIIFKTKQSNGSDGWQLVFEPNGQFYGMSNIITHGIESKSLKFRDPNLNPTNSQIYHLEKN